MFETEIAIVAFVSAWALVYALGRSKKLKDRGVNVKPFYIMVKSQRVGILDRLARHRRAWKLFANFSVFLGLILLFSSTGFLAVNLLNFFYMEASYTTIAVLIPGVTLQSFQALFYFFLSVPIILIVHEGAHGVIARLENIKIKSGGVLAVLVLLGGFVEPDEEEFKKASPSSRMRVLAAGSSANVIFSFLIAALLVSNPTFAMMVPTPIRPTLYGPASGVEILGLAESGGAKAAGIMVNDIITNVKDVEIRAPADFQKVSLKPNEAVQVRVLRGGEAKSFTIFTTPSSEDPSRGIVGVYPAGSPYYPPHLALTANWPRPVMAFLFWLWFLSLNIGLFNMLPFYPLDGDGFFNSLLSAKLSESSRNALRRSVNVFALTLLAANLIATFIKVGLVTM